MSRHLRERWFGVALLACALALALACGAASAPADSTAAPESPSSPQQSPKQHDRDSQASATSVDLLREGRRLLDAGKPEAAIEPLSQALARRPESSEHQLALGEAYVRAGRADAAIRLLENVLEGHPTNLGARQMLAEILCERAEWRRVDDLLTRVEATLGPTEALLLFRARHQGGDNALGRRALENGVERHPKHEPLRLALIDDECRAGRFASALKLIESAQAAIGATPELHFRAAQAYSQLGQFLGAVVSQRVPGGREGQFHKDLLLVSRAEGPDVFMCCPKASALYQIRRAIDGGVDRWQAHMMHAQIWQRLGKPQVGLEIMKAREAALLQEKPAVELLQVFRTLALESDELGDFLRYSQLAAAAEKDREPAILRESYLRLAERYNQRGQEAMYVDFLERALRLSPNDAQVLHWLAEAHWQAGRADKSIELYRDVLRLTPDHPDRQRIIARLAQWQESKAESD